jgi:hypothetical protein
LDDPSGKAQRYLVVLGIAAHQHEMFEIVGKAPALTACLVGAARADDHLEMGRGPGLVAHEKQVLAQPLLGGAGGEGRQQQ